jgi:hypothetical protein
MTRYFIGFLAAASLQAADWPMWRHDAGRTAATSQSLPDKLDLLWSRELPPLRPAYREPRLQFDRGYEPVAAGKTLLVGNSREDCVIAYDTDTGAERWRALADGPVRFAPVIVGDTAIFGADDGIVRCVRLSDGGEVWSKRAVPSERRLLGNQRLISVWPIRGGPVAKDGRVYFAAGVWPIEGTFVFCWDAATGAEVWRNDRGSHLYGVHPHQTEAMGGLAPQGYLLIDGEDLVVPCSTAYPARLDLKTGVIKQFELPSAGRLTGGWFASTPAEQEALKLKRRGLLFDEAVSAKRHEDKPRAEGLPGIQRRLFAAGAEVAFDRFANAHSVILADDKVFVVDQDGVLSAHGAGTGQAKHWPRQGIASQANEARAVDLLKAAGSERGYALVIGANSPGLIEALLHHSQFQLVILSGDTNLRKRLTEAGLYGERACVLDPKAAALPDALPPFFASVIFALGGDHTAFLPCLRPMGGRVVGPEAKILHTRGTLDGSTNYLADWKSSEDALVQAPLGVLWFDDALSNFKRSPQPKVVDGVMITADKDWLDASHRKGKVDYRLQAPVFSDIYTGRVLDEYEQPELRARFGTVDQETIQPAQYRPPTQTNDWSPGQPKAGLRVNPLTLEEEPRVFPKSYGCDGGFDYGGIYTFRSGTAAFYDKKVESGTIHISGPRSGCTNSVVPAGGILNVPYFYEGCTCSYPLPMGLALHSLPEAFEQWAVWGQVPKEALHGKIQRLGLNFGAPGDRKTRDGTLWLDFPSVGGPSPEIDFTTEPAQTETFYRHSLWMQPGEGWPWVAASGVKGLRRAQLSGLKNGRYSVRLLVASPDATRRRFAVTLQGKTVFTNVQPSERQAQTLTASEVRVSDGTLQLELTAQEGDTLLGGLEVVRDSD